MSLSKPADAAPLPPGDSTSAKPPQVALICMRDVKSYLERNMDAKAKRSFESLYAGHCDYRFRDGEAHSATRAIEEFASVLAKVEESRQRIGAPSRKPSRQSARKKAAAPASVPVLPDDWKATLLASPEWAAHVEALVTMRVAAKRKREEDAKQAQSDFYDLLDRVAALLPEAKRLRRSFEYESLHFADRLQEACRDAPKRPVPPPAAAL